MIEAVKPLSQWRFDGELRHSQRVIMGATEDQLGTGDPLHIVAPPGSGKTLLGLMLAIKQGDRALVLAPTTTVRVQWVKTAEGLCQGDSAAQKQVSENPDELGDLTALTYQMLSVLGMGNPFEPIARREWLAELVEAGRDEEDAIEWIKNIQSTNPKAYRTGILRRSRRIRRELVKQDEEAIEAALHPNARKLISRIADHGVTTIILDECHHLLDHWALVVRALTNKIEATGKTVTLIGLTATLPSLDDKNEFENYTGLLGEVDYELPTPAVVKEGNLAPYRSFAWFVTPNRDEIKFLREQEANLTELIQTKLNNTSGQKFLLQQLLLKGDEKDNEVDQKLAVAFSKDPVITEAVARLFWALNKKHHIKKLFPPEFRQDPTTEQNIRVLARYALEEILPNPKRNSEWESTRQILADFGFLLTDKGIRRGRDPVDTILATSIEKERAIGEILQLELSTINSEQIRAVVVCDFATHGNLRGKRKDDQSAGALRTFQTVVADPRLVALRPVLVTGKHLRIATRDFDFLTPKLQEIFGDAEMSVDDPPEENVIALKFKQIGPAKIVRAVSKLMTTGDVRLIVGTRGLLGEGWDCPALNTLIDLTAVGTSSATQQLYGRSIRLDPGWPEKVAHNWIVTAALDSSLKIGGDSDVVRMERKLKHLWGVSLESRNTITRGISHTLEYGQLLELQKILNPTVRGDHKKINAATRSLIPARSETYRAWRVGEPYASTISEEANIAKQPRVRSFATAITLEAIIFSLFAFIGTVFLLVFDELAKSKVVGFWPFAVSFLGSLLIFGFVLRKDLRRLLKSLKSFALPQRDYQGATLAIAEALSSRGVVDRIDRANVEVLPVREMGSRHVNHYQISLLGVPQEQQMIILDSLAELFEPIKNPRFLIEIGAVTFRDGFVGWLFSNLLKLFCNRSRFFAVPQLIGRRRVDAEVFYRLWIKEVGPCKLHEIKTPADMALLTIARRQSEPAVKETSLRPARREVWA